MSGFNEAIDYSPSDGKPFLRTGSASGSGTQQIVGNVAHDAVDSGNSVKVGGYAVDPTSPRTAVAVGDRVDLALTQNGHVPTYPAVLSAGEVLSVGTYGVIATVEQATSDSSFGCTRDTSTALEASSISKASAGNLYRAFGMVDKTVATGMYYILFLDSATLTADGAVTHLISPIPINHVNGADSSFDTEWFKTPVAAANGIVIVLSTTAVTKTIVTGGNVGLFATTLTK